MPNNTLTLYVDLTKEARSSIIRSLDYPSPEALPRLVLGEVRQLEIFLVRDGAVDAMSGDLTKEPTLSIGDPTTHGLVAGTQHFGTGVSGSYTCSLDLTTTLLVNAIDDAKQLNTKFQFEILDPTSLDGINNVVCLADLTIVNAIQNFTSSIFTSSQFYNTSQSDSRYLLKSEYSNSTASVQAGNGIVVTNFTNVNAVTTASYPAGAVVFAKNATMLTMSTNLVYMTTGEGLLVDYVAATGINSTLITASNARFITMSVIAPFTASHAYTAQTASQARYLVNQANHPVLIISSSSPAQYTTASLKGHFKLHGDPQVTTSRPKISFNSTTAAEPTATIQLDGTAESNIFLHLTFNTGSGTESLQRFLVDVPVTASTMEAATVITNVIENKSSNSITFEASGSNVLQLIGNQATIGHGSSPITDAALTVSGTIAPFSSSFHDIGSPTQYWDNVYANNLIGTASLCATSLTSSHLAGSSGSLNFSYWKKGSKSVTVTSASWTDVLTVNLGENQSVYFRLSLHGDWGGGVGPVGFLADGLITKGTLSDAGSQPGVLYSPLNYNKDSRLIGIKVTDPGLSSGTAPFPIALSSSFNAIPNGLLVWELQGSFTSVS
jgi:hypothetical protein